ncbi:MAG: M28 family peptidase, partial [Thiohalomonadales bacterium]
VYSINAHPSLAGISYSDHSNFWHFDYSAIMITDTAFYRNKNYHTIDDTWQKLNYNKMSMVIEAVQQSLLAHMKAN